MPAKVLNADRIKAAHAALVEIIECRPEVSDADGKTITKTLTILDGLFADLLA